MRSTIALAIALVAVPAAAQQPPVASSIPATPAIVGLTKAAEQTVVADVASYDLGGFRLGMSQPEAEAVVRSRGLTIKQVMRYVDFETQVRSLINIRGVAGGEGTKRGVLGEATISDQAGGSYMLKTLVWPDGAHLSSIVYIAPAGTTAADWRRMLVEKWGKPSEEQRGDAFVARWGSADAGFHARANLGPKGGTIEIAQPEGAGSQPSRLVERAADAFIAARAKKPVL